MKLIRDTTSVALLLVMFCSLAAAQAPREEFENSVGIRLVKIPAGEFVMGSEAGRDDERPIHRVRITKPFFLGQTELTNAQWKRVMGNVPSRWADDELPVENVSWHEAIQFCEKLSSLAEERKAGHLYRLPTEAEWEYACRAGSRTRFSFGDDESWLGNHGWYAGNSGSQCRSVGRKQSNAWGLYDMHGNVWEWCSDWYGPYPSDAVLDPQGAFRASGRVYRGGSCSDSAAACRSARRSAFLPSLRIFNLGFRVALGLPQAEQISPNPVSE